MLVAPERSPQRPVLRVERQAAQLAGQVAVQPAQPAPAQPAPLGQLAAQPALLALPSLDLHDMLVIDSLNILSSYSLRQIK